MTAAHETRLRQGKPSATAQGAAEGRAAHQLLDRPLIFEDRLAVRILGSDGEAKLRSELADHQTPLMRALRGQFLGRGRYAEDALAAAIGRGTRQYVVLGAGLDTFAYRNADHGVKVFEVDHPATQAWKRERLAEASIGAPATLSFAPVDFETQGLGDALASAGYDAHAPVFISCLGVCNYLQKDAFYQTLDWAASLVTGAEIVFDFMPEPSQQSAQVRAAMAQIAAKVMAHGEPLRSFFEPAELTAKALDLGFRQADVLSAAQVNAQYFEPAGSELRMRGYLMHARM